MLEFIEKNEIEFISTHQKLCLPIINRIYKKMCAGIRFENIKVEDRLICDGHHRYIASMLATFSLSYSPGKTTSATNVYDWKSVSFVEDDWDTEAKINMLNEQDAAYNNMPLEKIVQLLK